MTTAMVTVKMATARIKWQVREREIARGRERERGESTNDDGGSENKIIYNNNINVIDYYFN